jgi:endoglucanase
MIGSSRRLAVVAAALGCLITGPSAYAKQVTTTAASPSLPIAGLHVQGSRLVNAGGQPLQLIGVDRSSWEYDCIHPSWGILHEGPADQSEVATLQRWRINVVRVALNESCWLGISGASYQAVAYQQDVAGYVHLLARNNLAVILDLVYARPDGVLAGIDGRQWPMPNRAHSLAFWQSVASRFRASTNVIFEPYNEPTPDNDHAAGRAGATAAAWDCWRDGGVCPAVRGFDSFDAVGMQDLVTAIRATGATNPILVTGPDWGSDVSRWAEYRPADPLQQLVVGWHSYNDGLACKDSACWNSILAPLVRQYPLIADEIGQSDCRHQYIDQVMAFLDRQQQGYLAHTWGPYGCTVDPALIADWAGTPTHTYGQGYRDHLLRSGGGASIAPTGQSAWMLLLLGLGGVAAELAARWWPTRRQRQRAQPSSEHAATARAAVAPHQRS